MRRGSCKIFFTSPFINLFQRRLGVGCFIREFSAGSSSSSSYICVFIASCSMKKQNNQWWPRWAHSSWGIVSFNEGMSVLMLIKSISRIKEIYQRKINQILTKPRSLLPQAISDHFWTNDVVSAVDCVVLALSVMSFTVWRNLRPPKRLRIFLCVQSPPV